MFSVLPRLIPSGSANAPSFAGAKDRARRLREEGQIALRRHLEPSGCRSRVLIERKYGRTKILPR
jgi:hypothetical protein